MSRKKNWARHLSKAEMDRIVNHEITIARQCELLGLRRSSLYYETMGISQQNLLLMRTMGLVAMCPKRGLSKPAPGHRMYPYLLRGVNVVRVNQVWRTDIV